MATDMETIVNGIDVPALRSFVDAVNKHPGHGKATFAAVTSWQGGTRSRTQTVPLVLGGVAQEHGFVIDADEPPALLGSAAAPSPGDLMLSALNACMTVTYVANAAALGIGIESLSIRTQGNLDLRGFLGLDDTINPGFDQLEYEVEIKSTATSAELQALHEKVQRSSPNFHTLLRPVRLEGKLAILA